MLIFRHEDGGKLASPEQMQVWMQMTMDWIGGIAAQNKLVSTGSGLAFDDSRVVGHNNVVTNGPYTEIKELIGGYSVIKANTYEDAIELAKGCPIFESGGNVEIREVVPM